MIVPKDKPFLFLKGDGGKRTFIVWDDHLSITRSLKKQASILIFFHIFLNKSGDSFLKNKKMNILKYIK